jgi:glycine C-acetyltransferase/8-amino-7-oxononanoate synthase
MARSIRSPALRPSDRRTLESDLDDFHCPAGRDLFTRTEAFFEWQNARRANRLWPYSRVFETAASTTARIRYDDGVVGQGINLTSQDYLSLSGHPSIREAAVAAIRDFGVSASSSPVLAGNSRITLALERELADLLRMEHIALFTSGWCAAYGTITALVRPNDHVVVDERAAPPLQEAALASAHDVVHYPHLDTEEARAILAQLRAEDPHNGILLVTEALFPYEADRPKLGELQSACKEYDAKLLVSVMHDLGATGPAGTGQIGIENLLGEIDLVIGTFAKSFAANGGFLATRSRPVREFVKTFAGPHAFSTGLSPIAAGVALESIKIARAREGDALRMRLDSNAIALRAELASFGVACGGQSAPTVPVRVGSNAVARIASWLAFQSGCLVDVLEHPWVAPALVGFGLHCQAGHDHHELLTAAEILAGAICEARADPVRS